MPIQLRTAAEYQALLKNVRQNLTRPPVLPRIPLFVERERLLRLGREGGALSGRAPDGVDGDGVGGLSIGDCIPGGRVVTFGSNVPATTDQVIVGTKNFSGFFVNHIGYFAASAFSQILAISFKVSQDNDTSGGLDTSGVDMIDGTAIAALNPHTAFQQVFPAKRFDQRGLFIKVIFRNQSAGPILMNANVGLIFI